MGKITAQKLFRAYNKTEKEDRMRTCYIQACLAYVKIAFQSRLKEKMAFIAWQSGRKAGILIPFSLEREEEAETFVKIASENQ